MTRLSHTTKSVLPLDVAARALAGGEVAAGVGGAALRGGGGRARVPRAGGGGCFGRKGGPRGPPRGPKIEQPPAVAERKPRRPSIKKMIEGAEKAGKPLAS